MDKWNEISNEYNIPEECKSRLKQFYKLQTDIDYQFVDKDKMIHKYHTLKFLSYFFGLTFSFWIGLILTICNEISVPGCSSVGSFLMCVIFVGGMLGGFLGIILEPIGIIFGCILIPRLLDRYYLSEAEFNKSEKERKLREGGLSLIMTKSFYSKNKILDTPLFPE